MLISHIGGESDLEGTLVSPEGKMIPLRRTPGLKAPGRTRPQVLSPIIPELVSNRGHGPSNQRVVLLLQAIEGSQALPFRLRALAIKEAGFPAEALPDLICAPRRSVPSILACTCISQLMAVTAREDGTAVEQRHAMQAAPSTVSPFCLAAIGYRPFA